MMADPHKQALELNWELLDCVPVRAGVEDKPYGTSEAKSPIICYTVQQETA